jgi:hypothetical protein
MYILLYVHKQDDDKNIHEVGINGRGLNFKPNNGIASVQRWKTWDGLIGYEANSNNCRQDIIIS